MSEGIKTTTVGGESVPDAEVIIQPQVIRTVQPATEGIGEVTVEQIQTQATEQIAVEAPQTTVTTDAPVPEGGIVDAGVEPLTDKADVVDYQVSEEDQRLLNYKETVPEATVEVTDPTVRVRKPSDRFSPNLKMSLYYGTPEAALSCLVKNPRVGKPAENGEEWLAAFQAASSYYPRDETWQSTATGPAHFTQGITHNDRRYRVASTRLPVESGHKLVGPEALAVVSRALGQGEIIMIPLWHSGFWISIKAPTNAALFELDSRIARAKTTLGRMSNGYVFSNTSVIIGQHVANFVLEHVYSTNAPSSDAEWLRNHILTSDLPTLAWGISVAMYPNGFPLEQPCTADVSKCTYVDHAIADLAKMQWVNNAVLSEKQRSHMVKRNSRVTEKEILEYQEEFYIDPKYSQVTLNDEMTAVLTVPTLDKYFKSGTRWLDSLSTLAVDGYRGKDITDEDRDVYITNMASTMSVRQFTHWIKRLDVTRPGKGGNDTVSTIDDESAIELSSLNISSVPEVKGALIEGVRKFIDHTTVSLIGYVNTECPNCHNLIMKGNSGPFSRIIPIDAVTLFSHLRDQRLGQVEENGAIF